MNDILKDIYNQTREKVYNDADEYFNSQISFRFYEIYNENEQIRTLISKIDVLIREDIAIAKNCIIGGTISFIENNIAQMKQFIFADPSKKESIQRIYSSFIIESVSFLSGVNLNQDFLSNLNEAIFKNDLKKFILAIDINYDDIVNFYNRNLLGVYYVTALKDLQHINESNLYLVALTECLLNEYEYNLSRFNGCIKNTLCKNLEGLYQAKDYDLGKEPQWSKYKLIELNEHRHIAPMTIVDTKYKISFFHHLISANVLGFIQDYYQKFNFKLSLYPDCATLFNFEFEYSYVLEEVQYGIAPSIERLKNKLSDHQMKLIDVSLCDTFWIWNRGTDLYLEEIVSDFNIYQDAIVTKMIHVEFFNKESTIFIKHVDFEYIFYSEDEFINREDDISQKGQKYTRQKVFKIDNAEIPLNDIFLYFIAHNTFTNTRLVDEAFEKIGIINISN